jgi:predicted nucleic acid-binding protein
MARAVTRRRQRAAAAPALILDSGGVLALAADDQNARAVLTLAVRRGVPVIVPAPVVTETVRGTPRDAPVNRVINAVGEVVPVDERLARFAGALIGSTRSHAGAVDALVVATATAAGGGVVLTSDPNDIARLARDHPAVVIHTV